MQLPDPQYQIPLPRQSLVYFSTLKTSANEHILQKMRRLLSRSGIADLDFQGKYTAIKVHFGEIGNMACLRPQYVRVIVDMVKELGGLPFLTDCTSIYTGTRKNALEHLDTAFANGFLPSCVGCQIIIADGLKGTDELSVPLSDGEYVKAAKIGRAVMDADILISLNHFTAHESTGFAGAIKNIGSGSASRGGKTDIYLEGKPSVAEDLCIGCRACASSCAHEAIRFKIDAVSNQKAVINHDRCIGCRRCISACPKDALYLEDIQANTILNCKIAEYAAAALREKPAFHISLVTDVTPFSDSHTENDIPIVSDVGIFASADPVALDQACIDAVQAEPALAGSLLAARVDTHTDYFSALHPSTDWKAQILHAQKMHIGIQSYRLVNV